MKANRKIGNSEYYAKHASYYTGISIAVLIFTALVAGVDGFAAQSSYGGSVLTGLGVFLAVFLMERIHRMTTIKGVSAILQGETATINGVASILKMLGAFGVIVIIQLTLRHNAVDMLTPKPHFATISDSSIVKSQQAIEATIATVQANANTLRNSALKSANTAAKTTANKVANWGDRESANRMIAQAKAKSNAQAATRIEQYNAEALKASIEVARLQVMRDSLFALNKAKVDALNAAEMQKYMELKESKANLIQMISWIVVFLFTSVYIWTADFYVKSQITYEHVPSKLDHLPSGASSILSAIGVFGKAILIKIANGIEGMAMIDNTTVAEEVNYDETKQTRVVYTASKPPEGEQRNVEIVDIPEKLRRDLRNFYNAQDPNIKSRGSSKPENLAKAREKYKAFVSELESKGYKVVDGKKITISQ